VIEFCVRVFEFVGKKKTQKKKKKEKRKKLKRTQNSNAEDAKRANATPMEADD